LLRPADVVFAAGGTREFIGPELSKSAGVGAAMGLLVLEHGNITSNGITADLEAMRRVGIGGVLIMDVAVERYGRETCGPPRGTAEFMNPEWQHLFQFSVQEAARLGLEINMDNGPGWTGSSGPWITPELSMQKLVWTNSTVTGPTNFSAVLPVPDISAKYVLSLAAKVQYTDFVPLRLNVSCAYEPAATPS
jgi:hypothetical protein